MANVLENETNSESRGTTRRAFSGRTDVMSMGHIMVLQRMSYTTVSNTLNLCRFASFACRHWLRFLSHVVDSTCGIHNAVIFLALDSTRFVGVSSSENYLDTRISLSNLGQQIGEVK